MAKASRILVPVDGSKCALRALRYAAAKVKACGRGMIVLVNVQQALAPSLFVTAQMIRDYQRRNSDPIIKHASAIARKLGVTTQPLVRVGDPASTIARLARDHRCSEIVMGTRGLGRLAAAVLGSTSTRLFRVTRLPVTLIR